MVKSEKTTVAPPTIHSTAANEVKDCTHKADWGASKRSSWLFAIVVLLVIVGVFSKTIFSGQCISKLNLLAQTDSLFNPSMKLWRSPRPLDHALYKAHFPIQVLKERAWQTGNLPLWNPYNGCGSTIIGDIQYCVFSPFQRLFPPSSLYLYNLGIVVKVMGGALGMFFLGRQFALPAYAACLAALAYSLCPFILRELELVNETWLLPIMAFLIARLATKKNVWSVAALGASCAVFIMSMHPEFSFMGIVLGSLLALCLASTRIPAAAARRAVFSLIGWLSAGGVVAFLLASPVLLPFLEFLIHGQCYKLGGFDVQRAHWQGLLLGLANPMFGPGSSYIGVICAVLVPLSLFSQRPVSRYLLWLCVLAFLVATTPGPLLQLFSLKPLSFFMPKYAIGALLLILALLAALGMEELVERKFLGLRRWLVLIASSAVVVCVPWLLSAYHVELAKWNYDKSLPSMAVNLARAHTDLIVITILILGLAGQWYFRLPGKMSKVALILILSLFSEGSAARIALSKQMPFQYPAVDPLPWLMKQDDRILAVEQELSRGNTSAVYGIRDLDLYGVILSRRFADVSWRDRSPRNFCSQQPTPMVDLASAKYMVSRSPVICTTDSLGDLETVKELMSQPIRFGPRVELQMASVSYNRQPCDITAQLTWRADWDARRDYAMQPVLLDAKGMEIWSGAETALQQPEWKGQNFAHTMLWSVPAGLPSGTRVLAGLVMLNAWSHARLWPDSCPLKLSGPIMVLGQFETSVNLPARNSSSAVAMRAAPVTDSKPEQRHFRLLFETPSQIRVYENPHAVPQAYIVHQILKAGNDEEALRLISSPKFSPLSQVVLEGFSGPGPGDISRAVQARADKIGHVNRSNPNAVSLDFNASSAGILVLTDTYYPGWKALLDGYPVPIYPANHVFRAVEIPPGQHHLEFRYEPASLSLGFMLAGACAFFFLVIFLLRRRAARGLINQE